MIIVLVTGIDLTLHAPHISIEGTFITPEIQSWYVQVLCLKKQ